MTNRDRRTERREEDRMTRRTPTEMAHAKLRTAVDKVERARHRVERAEEELAAARTAVKSAVVARDYADELSEALHQLVARVQDTGRKGALTLVITVEPLPKGDGRALVISDEIKLKLPAAHPQLKHDTEPQPVEEGDR